MARKDISDLLVCQAVHDRSRDILDMPMLDELLQERTGEHMKVVYAALERASDRCLIEYGVSLRGAWLTANGCALLADAAAAGVPLKETRGLHSLVALGLLK
jgi:hypothetical protein